MFSNLNEMKQQEDEKNIAVNRKARHEFAILQTFETGIVLVGTEVKALREGKANLVDSYALIQNNEVWLLSLQWRIHVSVPTIQL